MDWEGLLYRLEDWWSGVDKRRLLEVIVVAALSFLLTAYARIPFDVTYTVGRQQLNAGVCATLGDVCLYFGVLVLGAPWAPAVCAVCMALADLAAGAKLFFIGTLFIKFGVAYFIAAFALNCDTFVKSLAVAGIAEGLMFILYFLYSLVFVSVSAALHALPADLLQGAVCACLGALLLWKMEPLRPRELPRIRRTREIGHFDEEI